MSAARTALAVMGAIAPTLAAEIAYRLWGQLGRPAGVHERDRSVHEEADTSLLEVNGERVVTYTWGSGHRVILLVHGWRSRAARFSALVRTLQSPEHTIVSFDAPGNGSSSGARTTILDYAAAIRMLGEKHGEFDAIIGHSFGVLASFLAVREGVRTRRLVGVAGMYSADQLVDGFSNLAGIRGRAKSGLRTRIARRTFATVADPWRRFIAEIDPAHTHIPLLLIHDADDTTVPVTEAELIANAHTGEVTTMLTRGLGHSRILSDPAVLATISSFTLEQPAPTKSSTS